MSKVEKISVAISNELLRVVRSAVGSGEYASSSEVMREALREWKARRTPLSPLSEQQPVPGARLLPLSAQRQGMIDALAQRFGVRRLALFGSALRADFTADSDVDVAVEFEEASVLDPVRQYFALQEELAALFGRSVDLVELPAMPESRLKREILRTQVVIHGQQAA